MWKKWITEHQWQTALVGSIIVFTLNSARRLFQANRRMPPQVKLEISMHRAARAIRNLRGAVRTLDRLQGLRRLSVGYYNPETIRRLMNAHSASRCAKDHLEAVLKKASGLHCPILVLQHLSGYSAMADRVAGDCLAEARVRPEIGLTAPSVITSDLPALMGNVEVLLAQVSRFMNTWHRELETASADLEGKVPPAIYRSGGAFRNPFKSENALEDDQTRSVLMLKDSREDWKKVDTALQAVKSAMHCLHGGGPEDVAEILKPIRQALDAVDTALADVNMPLASELATGEGPFDPPDAVPDPGILQKLHALLTRTEIALLARGDHTGRT